MENIRFSENITALRKSKKVTQEQLANFCGVTKASVSKWETKQSMPDVFLLPRLASFFGVTVDELIGYEAYLAKEQIQKIYEELSADFATKEFEAVMAKCREYVKEYYTCYDFLEKIVLLWMNHDILAGEKKADILLEAKGLCEHILEGSRDIRLCNDVIFLKAIIDLQLGNPSAVIEALEDTNDPCRLSVQGEDILLRAYLYAGMTEKADEFSQMTMYYHLVALISAAGKFLMVHKDNLEKCEETLRRIEGVIKIYNLEEVNFNAVVLFEYYMAVLYCTYNAKEKAFHCFKKYVDLTMEYLRTGENYLNCDDYFERLDIWSEKNVLGGKLPRSKKIIYDNLISSFEASEFAILKDEDYFIALLKYVKQEGELFNI